MPEATAAAHASFLLAMPAHSAAALTAFWFAGDRESAPNVQIAAAQFDRASQSWSAARFVLNRHTLGQQLGFGVRRLGNPVAWMDPQDRMHLFVVATGWGGWAASSIIHLRQVGSSDRLQDLRFEPVRELTLSWLWNYSFLVRNAPLALDDGGMVLPIHFEMGIKYPVALRFDRDGEFVGMARMSRRQQALQPTLLLQSPDAWLALLRDQRPNGKIGVVATQDGGQHWQDLPDLPLDNPDAAAAALTLSPGEMLLVHNPSTESRTQLDLSQSSDGTHWTRLATLQQGAQGDEFSYPSLAWADQSLWISHTLQRKAIAWQRFAAVPGAAKAHP
jgi:predicted neuraminidase